MRCSFPGVALVMAPVMSVVELGISLSGVGCARDEAHLAMGACH